MNTDLSSEITITCSKGHGKIANNNSSQTWQKITEHDRNNIRLQCLELSNNMLQELIIASKGMHANTKYKEQNYLTERIPKINRKDGRVDANMAIDMADSE